MAGCEKCWHEAGIRAGGVFGYGDKTKEYHKLLEEKKDNPCYLDCPNNYPDHYSYTGCPSCGYRWGES